MKQLIIALSIPLALSACSQKPATPAGETSVSENEALNSAAEMLDTNNQRVTDGAGAQKE